MLLRHWLLKIVIIDDYGPIADILNDEVDEHCIVFGKDN